MPRNLLALLVVLALSGPLLWVAERQLCPQALDRAAFARRRNAWLGLTAITFLAPTFWLLLLMAAVLVAALGLRDTHRFALYLFLLFAVPPSPGRVLSLGLWTDTIGLDAPRLLGLLLLLPGCLAWRRNPEVPPLGTTLLDRCVMSFCLFMLAIHGLQSPERGEIPRHALSLFVDIVLPYWAASRTLRTLAAFREALVCLVLAIMLMIPLLWFELGSHWLLYDQLAAPSTHALLSDWYSGRVSLPAMASAGHPRTLGYLVLVALCLFACVHRVVRSSRVAMLGWVILLSAWSTSRAFWLCGLVAWGSMCATGRNPASRCARMLLAATIFIVFLIILLLSPVGPLLGVVIFPWPQTPDMHSHLSTHYSVRLLETCLQVISLNPLFGSIASHEFPMMQPLKDSHGHLLLNSAYMGLASTYGLVGLAVYLCMFLGAGWTLRRALKAPLDEDTRRLGRVLLAALLATLPALMSIHAIHQVATVQMILLGLCAGYGHLVSQTRSDQKNLAFKLA